MKKLLSILGSIGIIATGASSVMAMSPQIKTNQPSVERINQAVPDFLKVIDVPSTANVQVDTVNSVIIKNYTELSNVTVTSSNNEIASAWIVDGNVEIHGISQGTTTLIVVADDAEDAIITVTVNEWMVIDVAKNADVDVDKITGLKINNFKDLVNVTATSDNDEIATASIFDDNVVIKGRRQGTAKVTVSAYYAQNVIITVTVNELKEITVDKEEVIVYGNEQEQVKISNFTDLTGVQVYSQDNSIVTATLDNQGTITITGVTAGMTTIKVIADHANEKNIAVEVKALSNITVDRNQVTVYNSLPEIVNIINITDLTRVEVTSINTEVVTVTFDGETGVITIVQAQEAKIGDKTTVEITADHAKKTSIQVTIVDQLALTDRLTTLAIDNVQESQVIDEVVKLNPILTKTDIKVQEGSFQAPDGLKLGWVIVETDTNKYTGEIKLLIVPEIARDEKTEMLLAALVAEKDVNRRKPIWKEYFEYKGKVFFETLMAANSWSFKNSDFLIVGENKELKREVLNYMTHQWDAVAQRLMRKDYRDYNITRDYSGYQYGLDWDYETNVIGNDVSVDFSGLYTFAWDDMTNFTIKFAGEVKGTIID